MGKILIVDDHKITRKGLKRIIGRIDGCDYEILEAEDGESAEKIALQEHPDIIMTDIKMPNITGLELIARLKPRLKDSHFVIISGYDDFTFARQAIKLGVEDYLLKPLNREDVESLIIKLLNEIGIAKEKDRNEIKVVKEEDLSKIVNVKEEDLNENKIVQKLIIEFTIDYISNNYYKDLTLTCMSNLVSKSYNYFSTLFKNETGYNFSTYLRNVRIEKAKELLKNIDSKAMDVAKEVGYENYIHFSKTFTKVVGVNPAKYKLNCRT